MRVEQRSLTGAFIAKVLGYASLSLGYSFFLKWRNIFFLAKVLAKVHVDMSKFAYVFIVDPDLLCMFHFVKTNWVIFRESLAKV